MVRNDLLLSKKVKLGCVSVSTIIRSSDPTVPYNRYRAVHE